MAPSIQRGPKPGVLQASNCVIVRAESERKRFLGRLLFIISGGITVKGDDNTKSPVLCDFKVLPCLFHKIRLMILMTHNNPAACWDLLWHDMMKQHITSSCWAPSPLQQALEDTAQYEPTQITCTGKYLIPVLLCYLA